jgi:hypothetical protein
MMSVRTFSFKKDITGTESLFSWGMSLRLLFWAWHSWVSFLPCGWRHWELSPLNVTSFVGFLLRGWLHCELSLKRWRHWELSPLRMTSLRAFFFEDVVTKSFLLWEWRHWEPSPFPHSPQCRRDCPSLPEVYSTLFSNNNEVLQTEKEIQVKGEKNKNKNNGKERSALGGKCKIICNQCKLQN